MPLVQIQRSACSAPQLWPTIPRQPFSSITRSRTVTVPLKVVDGCGLSVFVRGTGARYIQPRGRWWNAAGPAASKLRSQDGESWSLTAVPTARPGVIVLPPPRTYPPSGTLRASGPTVIFDACGPSASNSVNHTEPVGSPPGG